MSVTIIASIFPRKIEEIDTFIRRAEKTHCDWIELRVDGLDPVQLFENLSEISSEKPFLFTYRSRNECGEGDWDEEMVEKVLQTAIPNFPMIDIETSIPKAIRNDLLQQAKKKGTKIIRSVHSVSLPNDEEIVRWVKEMVADEIDIVKVAVGIKNKEELTRFQSLTDSIKKNHPSQSFIFIGMGEEGRETRIHPARFHSDATFGSVEEVTAPGQLHVDEIFHKRSHKTRKTK